MSIVLINTSVIRRDSQELANHLKRMFHTIKVEERTHYVLDNIKVFVEFCFSKQ